MPFASRKYIQKEIEITSENSEYEIADYIAENSVMNTCLIILGAE